MFGIGFILGPVLGGLFAGSSLTSLGYISGACIFVNFLIIIFLLPDIKKKHLEASEESIMPGEFHHHKKQIYLLFATAFITALGFSAMQATFSLILSDRFHFDTKLIGYCFGFIGIIAVIYQAVLIRQMQKIFSEKGMIIFGLFVLAFSFALFAFNPYVFALFIIIA